MAGAHLASAALTGATFREGDLSDVIAPDANFTAVNVVGTTFTNAVLTRAVLVL
ncbi:pentapeptide repeat-containing protein, partial [Micromonospora chalcea]